MFRLSVFEGLSHQEIGQLLGIAPHSSSSQLSHAKQMLRLLIRRSWVLGLLLIAIPAAIWKLQQEKVQEDRGEKLEVRGERKVSGIKSSSRPVRYQAETVVQPDSIPYHIIEEPIDTLTVTAQSEERQQDTLIYQQLPSLPPIVEPVYTASTRTMPSAWDIRLTYNGLMGQRDDYLAAATIGKGSFNAVSNTPIPGEQAFDNWAGYNYYLSNSPLVPDDAETRSLMNIAVQNSVINDGKMEARHEHQLPVTIQLMLSRHLSQRLSLETGLSYTQMKSKTQTGSADAYIEEQQRLRYLGIPLRLGYKWLDKARFSLYASAGVMFEMPIHSTLDVQHIFNGNTTFRDKSVLSVPCQFSTTLGIGLQYDLTPHLGLFLEPSLQYFIPDGSDIQSYRTEHPLQIALPVGIRFQW